MEKQELAELLDKMADDFNTMHAHGLEGDITTLTANGFKMIHAAKTEAQRLRDEASTPSRTVRDILNDLVSELTQLRAEINKQDVQPNSKLAIWEPPCTGWTVYGEGTISGNNTPLVYPRSYAQAGSVFPTKETAADANVTITTERRLLSYIADHWPNIKQPRNFADIHQQQWWTVADLGSGYEPFRVVYYIPGRVCVNTEYQAQQICEDIKSKRLVL